MLIQGATVMQWLPLFLGLLIPGYAFLCRDGMDGWMDGSTIISGGNTTVISGL